METKNTILQIENLKVEFRVGKKCVHAVNDVNLTVHRGKTLGIVGESGCGKSVTAHSILKLLPQNGRIVDGKILFAETAEGPVKELQNMKRTGQEIRAIRGQKIAMIFQDPMMSLNPVYTIGSQIMENLKLHEKLEEREAKARIIHLLGQLGIPEPEQRYKEYPHQFSGGMKQRVMIAIAMICNPSLLIADEPTTALDVTIQKQILRLMQKLRDDFGTSVILITHNMGIVAEACDEVAVMYMGRVVESGPVRQIFENPQHPYTRALLRSVPVPGMRSDVELKSIEGSTPDASIQFDHCEFEPRCEYASEQCRGGFPQARECEPGHVVRCFLRGGGES
ncbi:MAG: ABC transporter ATP-binding protein [Lachnospiraceae bacterium]|nr:ABC transporter ATP-binding protein [Lachnospiraceae bacterium]